MSGTWINIEAQVVGTNFSPTESGASQLNVYYYLSDHIQIGANAQKSAVQLTRDAKAAAVRSQPFNMHVLVPHSTAEHWSGRIFVAVSARVQTKEPTVSEVHMGSAEILVGSLMQSIGDGDGGVKLPLALLYSRPDDETIKIIQQNDRNLETVLAELYEADKPYLKGYLHIRSMHVAADRSGALPRVLQQPQPGEEVQQQLLIERVTSQAIAVGVQSRTLYPVMPVKLDQETGELSLNEELLMPPSREEARRMHPFRYMQNGFFAPPAAFALHAHLRDSDSDSAAAANFLLTLMRVTLRREDVDERTFIDEARADRNVAFNSMLVCTACATLGPSMPYASDVTFLPKTDEMRMVEHWDQQLMRGRGDCEDSANTNYRVLTALRRTRSQHPLLLATRRLAQRFIPMCLVTTVSGAQVSDADDDKQPKATPEQLRRAAIGDPLDVKQSIGGHMTCIAMPRQQFARMIAVAHGMQRAVDVEQALGPFDEHDATLRVHVLEGTGRLHPHVAPIEAYYRGADVREREAAVAREKAFLRARRVLMEQHEWLAELADHKRYGQANPDAFTYPEREPVWRDARLTRFFRDGTHVFTGVLLDHGMPDVSFFLVQTSAQRGVPGQQLHYGVAMRDLVLGAGEPGQRAFGLLAESVMSTQELQFVARGLSNMTPLPPLAVAEAQVPQDSVRSLRDAALSQMGHDDCVAVAFTFPISVMKRSDWQRMLQELKNNRIVVHGGMAVYTETLYGDEASCCTSELHTVTVKLLVSQTTNAAAMLSLTNGVMDDIHAHHRRTHVDSLPSRRAGRFAHMIDSV